MNRILFEVLLLEAVLNQNNEIPLHSFSASLLLLHSSSNLLDIIFHPWNSPFISSAAKPAAPVQQAAAAPAPQVEAGIPGDVVAAIMAAIHVMGNGKYTLKAVRRSKNGWGNAGVNDTTAPF